MLEILDRVVDRVGGRQRLLLIGTGIGAVAFILALSWWATRPDWVPVFSDLPLQSVGKLSDKLTEAGIPFRLDAGGTQLVVPAPDVARARVALAREGLPSAGRPGLELFDQPSWGMTDFTQRINYRRALEGELERTIGKMRGVEAAEVHLALNETSSFRQAEKPGRASVVLKLRDGTSPSAEVVQGISQLVASSVGEMSSDDVMVLDDGGRLLSIPNEQGSLGALTSRQLAVQRDVEANLRRKAEEIAANVIGDADVRVQVSADINFDHVERTSQLVDPDRQVTAAEQKAQIIPGAQGGAASTNSSTSYENSRTIESFTGAVGTIRRLSVAVLVNERPAATGGTKAAGSLPTSAAELARLRQLISAAVGADPRRGDVISVETVAFRAAPPPLRQRPTVWEVTQRSIRPGLLFFGLLLAFIVALRLIRSLRPPAVQGGSVLPPATTNALLPDGTSVTEPLLVGVAADDDLFAPIEQRMDPAKQSAVRIVAEQPELAVRVIRGWLREA